MPEQRFLNYPDVLGYMTQSARAEAGPLQVALAAFPPIVSQGNPITLLLLAQNLLDSPVELAVSLALPDKDSAGKKGQFRVQKDKLTATVKPGEVGYLGFPAAVSPQVAPGSYSFVMELNSKAQDRKAGQVRQLDGGSPFDPDCISGERGSLISGLCKLTYVTSVRSGLLKSGYTIEAPFQVSAKAAKPLRLKPGWVPLWTVADLDDATMLLDKYREMMRLRVLPKLERNAFFEPLQQKTDAVFKRANYPLTPAETACIARLMCLILEYGNAANTAQSVVDGGIYGIGARMKPDYREHENSPPLPQWTQAYLKKLVEDERIASAPQKAIPQLMYFDLLVDAVIYGFTLIERNTGEDVGTEEEFAAYAAHLKETLQKGDTLSFSQAYMPLILGGVIASDRVLLGDERLVEVLDTLKHMIDDRLDEQDESNEIVFDMVERVITLNLRKYGSLDSRNR